MSQRSYDGNGLRVQKQVGSVRNFTPSLPGQPGSVYIRTPDGNAFTVENDSRRFSRKKLSWEADADDGGLTRPSQPYTNYTANDLTPEQTVIVQVHELGHSLAYITKTPSSQSPKKSVREQEAKAFEECLLSGLLEDLTNRAGQQ